MNTYLDTYYIGTYMVRYLQGQPLGFDIHNVKTKDLSGPESFTNLPKKKQCKDFMSFCPSI